MPSPFPGIDPYLEAAHLWEDVHARLASEISSQIQPRLVPRYVAVLTPYVTYEDISIGETTAIKPDVAVLTRARPATNGASTAIAPAPITGVTSVLDPEAPAKAQRIEIRVVGSETLVTVIEILSPANKRPGTDPYEQYQRKRRDLLNSDVHLMEIDLLRRGVGWPLDAPQPLPPAPYFVFLSRAGQRPLVEIWPLTFREPPPVLPIPLRAPDDDVPLDLAAAYARIYEQGAYAFRVNYLQDPPPPALSAADAAWLADLLRDAGLR